MLRPFVDTAVDAFGPDRLMIGSDWPVCEIAGGYSRVWNALTALVEDVIPEGRSAILGETAARVYRLRPRHKG